MAEADEKGQTIKAYGFNPTTMQLGLWSTDPIWQAETPNGSLTDPKARYDWLHTDHLGTPILATIKEGRTSWKAIAESFGSTQIIEQDIEMNLRFPGQYFDAETGTHYNFHRDYRPNAGRYLQGDPIGVRGGDNIFSYANDSPYLFIDPKGLSVTWSGSITGLGATFGMGGYLGRFSLESKCKCNKKYTIKGFISLVTFGAGAKYLPDLGGSFGGVSLVDRWANCPDPSAATGGAVNTGVNIILSAGGSFLTTWGLGRLRSINYIDGPSFGLDVSITFGMRASVVTSVKEEKCSECES